MFEKHKANKIYKMLLSDLNETKELYQQSNKYDGIDRGTVAVPIKPKQKLCDHLKALAEQDGYNLTVSSFQHSLNNEMYTTLYSITNEKPQEKQLVKSRKTV